MLPLGIGDLVRRRFEGHGISSSSESLSVKNAYNLMSFFLLDQSIKKCPSTTIFVASIVL